MKILTFTSLDNELKARLIAELSGDEVIFAGDLSFTELEDIFKEAEVILGNPPVNFFKEYPTNLRFWHLDSAGFDQYKHLQADIPVANMGSFFARKCSETIVAGVLCFYRGIDELTRLKSKKEWNGKEIRKGLQLLGDKSVLVLGAGAIGLDIKKKLLAFGCQVTATSRDSSRGDIHSIDQIFEVLPRTDLLINTLPGTAEYFVKGEMFDALKSGSVYASVGRGNTTDEFALLSALESGKLAGAVLDVTAQEPLSETSKLWDMKNVILTQHTGGGDANEEKGKVEQFIANIKRYCKGEEIEDIVVLKRGY